MADEIPAEQAHHLFIGKTITAFEPVSCNQIEFGFSDGTVAVFHIECGHYGLPDVLVCTHCATAIPLDGMEKLS